MDEGAVGVSVRGFLVVLCRGKIGRYRNHPGNIRQGARFYTQRVNGLQPNKILCPPMPPMRGNGVRIEPEDRIMAYELAPGWSNAKKANFGEDWWGPWFGMFHLQDDSGWIHHLSMGWAYAMWPRVESALDRRTGWAWTDEGIYPSCIPRFQSWLYFYGKSKDQILFYRYSDSRWMVNQELVKTIELYNEFPSEVNRNHLFVLKKFLKKFIWSGRYLAILWIFHSGILLGSSKIFWSDFTAKKIQSANLDGSGLTDLVTGLSNPKGDLAIDEQNQKVYWIDAGAGNLQRADLDGSNVETIVTGIGSGGRGLDLDIPNGHIYWGDYSSNVIKRCNLDGTGVTFIHPSLQGNRGHALDLANGKIYWTERTTNMVKRSNLDGTSPETVASGLNYAYGNNSGLDKRSYLFFRLGWKRNLPFRIWTEITRLHSFPILVGP